MLGTALRKGPTPPAIARWGHPQKELITKECDGRECDAIGTIFGAVLEIDFVDDSVGGKHVRRGAGRLFIGENAAAGGETDANFAGDSIAGPFLRDEGNAKLGFEAVAQIDKKEIEFFFVSQVAIAI